jgi:hypothetical protein
MTLLETREEVAERLLRSSERRSCDPTTEVDWDAPLDPDLPAMPWHRVSLHGTPLWDRLDHRQRVRLSWHELASMSSVGLWFELILMQALLRYAYDRDPRTAHLQYALTEVGDETRHFVMFARAAERLAPGMRYRPARRTHQLGRLYKTVAFGPSLFASVLVAEETLDRVQREVIRTEGLLPLAQQVSRVHVLEEARHVSYARAAVTRQVPALSRGELEAVRLATAVTSAYVVNSFLDPRVYAAVGLDPVQAARVAREGESHRATRLWMAERVIGFLRDAGLVAGPSTAVWRRAGLV